MIKKTAKMMVTVCKANLETNISSWPMFVICNSLLAQHFPCNNFGDPVKSLPPPSVPYFMTAPLAVVSY